MSGNEARAVLLFIGVGMKILSARIMLLLALLMTFGLFCWAMVLPDYNRIAAATIFTVLVFLPTIRADSKQNEAKASQGEANVE